jgi:transposase
MPGAYSTDLRERVLVAVEAGESPNMVAEEFMVGRSSVYRWIAAARDEGRRVPKPMGGGPQPIIRDEIEVTLRRLLEANNHLTLVECRDQLATETGVRVNPGPLVAHCAGWTGRERSAAFSPLSRSVTPSCRRVRLGRWMMPPGLVALHRSGWCFLMKARC